MPITGCWCVQSRPVRTNNQCHPLVPWWNSKNTPIQIINFQGRVDGFFKTPTTFQAWKWAWHCEFPRLTRIQPKRKGRHSLRSESAVLLEVPRVRHSTIGGRAFAFTAPNLTAPNLWNKLPTQLRNTKSLQTYKSLLKAHLFAAAFGDNSAWDTQCWVIWALKNNYFVWFLDPAQTNHVYKSSTITT
jgi:hypothetical protein